MAGHLLGNLFGWAYLLLCGVLLIAFIGTLISLINGKGSLQNRLGTMGVGLLVISVAFALAPGIARAIKIPIPFKVPARQKIPIPMELARGTEVIGSYAGEGVIHGGINDHIDFAILGPKQKVLFTKMDAPTGNFSITAEESGTYTFVVDNTGMFRLTDRSVLVTASMVPGWSKDVGRWWYLATIAGVICLVLAATLHRPAQGSGVETPAQEQHLRD